MSVPTPSRRSLLAASAWSVPAVVVASAAPAFATSPAPIADCDVDYSLRWANFNAQTGVVVAQSVTGAAPLTLSVTNQFRGNMTAASAVENRQTYQNLRVSPVAVGGLTRGLTLMQRISNGMPASSRRANRQEVTFRFSRPVKGLSFSVTDIDSLMPGGGSQQYRDQVEITGAPAAEFGSGALRGSGTLGAPWWNSNNSGYTTGSANGNVRVQFAPTVSVQQVVLTFWNNADNGTDWYGRMRPLSADGLQGVFVTDMSLRAANC